MCEKLLNSQLVHNNNDSNKCLRTWGVLTHCTSCVLPQCAEVSQHLGAIFILHRRVGILVLSAIAVLLLRLIINEETAACGAQKTLFRCDWRRHHSVLTLQAETRKCRIQILAFQMKVSC